MNNRIRIVYLLKKKKQKNKKEGNKGKKGRTRLLS